MRTWLKVTAALPCVPVEWSVFHDAFVRHGLEGTVQTDQPPTISAFLPPGEESSLPALATDLESLGARVKTEEVEEVDWSEAWKQFFKPLAVGKRLWIRPSWEEAVVPDGRAEIVLDPGQAFGTGDHPTTRLCLELLEGTVAWGDMVADIGCGSGILSIAAKKLGAGRVLAVDTDPVSVAATLENAKLNEVEVAAFEGCGFAPLPATRFEVAVSNIISAAIIGLAREAYDQIDTGGHWIVSGIIETNWQDVRGAVEQAGFEVKEVRQEGDWVAAKLLRPWKEEDWEKTAKPR